MPMFDSSITVVNVLPAIAVNSGGRDDVMVPLDPSARPDEAPAASTLAGIMGMGLPFVDLPRYRDTPSFAFASSCRDGEPDPFGYLRFLAGDAMERGLPTVTPQGTAAALVALEGHSPTAFDMEKYHLNGLQVSQLVRWLRAAVAAGLGLYAEFSSSTYSLEGPVRR